MSKEKEYKIIKDLRKLKGTIPDQDFERIISEAKLDKFIVGSIRNKSLQKVLRIAAEINMTDTPLRKELCARLIKKGQYLTVANLIYSLTLNDIQKIIGCNSRTAKDYQMFFRNLSTFLM